MTVPYQAILGRLIRRGERQDSDWLLASPSLSNLPFSAGVTAPSRAPTAALSRAVGPFL